MFIHKTIVYLHSDLHYIGNTSVLQRQLGLVKMFFSPTILHDTLSEVLAISFRQSWRVGGYDTALLKNYNSLDSPWDLLLPILLPYPQTFPHTPQYSSVLWPNMDGA